MYSYKICNHIYVIIFIIHTCIRVQNYTPIKNVIIFSIKIVLIYV